MIILQTLTFSITSALTVSISSHVFILKLFLIITFLGKMMKFMLAVFSILHICQSSQIALNNLDNSFKSLYLLDAREVLENEIAGRELLNQEKRSERRIKDIPRLDREVSRFSREVPRLGREVPRLGREIPRLGREVPRLGREVPRLGRETSSFGREVPRLGREVPRLGREVPRLGRETSSFGREVPRLGREVPRLGREVPRLGREVPRLGREASSTGREIQRLDREVQRVGKEVSNIGRISDDEYLDGLLSTYSKLKREVTEDILSELENTEQGKRILQAFNLGSRESVMKKSHEKVVNTGKRSLKEEIEISLPEEGGLDDDGYGNNKRQISFLHVKRNNLKTLLQKITGNEPK